MCRCHLPRPMKRRRRRRRKLTQNSWSDGLGDPSGNTLPRCQLKRLGKLIAALPSSPDVPQVVDCCFWIDTLCIPKDRALRKHAIVKMRDVYKLAINVLVLNTELMRASCNRPYTEIFTRITCSSWLRRLWTLQEGLLNFNLLFQFSEGVVAVGLHSRLYTAQSEDNTQNPWDLVAWECSRYCFHVLMHFPLYSDVLQVNFIWSALKNRTTSRVGDEPLCIAILLDLNIDELQKAPADDRVRKFWSLHVKGLPASVLFLPGKKLLNEGFGWAPADLMQLKILGTEINCRGMITRRGLQISYPGFTLSQPDHSPNYVLPWPGRRGNLFHKATSSRRNAFLGGFKSTQMQKPCSYPLYSQRFGRESFRRRRGNRHGGSKCERNQMWTWSSCERPGGWA